MLPAGSTLPGDGELTESDGGRLHRPWEVGELSTDPESSPEWLWFWVGLELDLLWWVGLGPVLPEADPEELELLLVLEVSPLGAGPDALRRVETGEPGSRSLKSGLLSVLSEKLREFRKRLVRVSICDIFFFFRRKYRRGV